MEKKHRYKIKTHGTFGACSDATCYAAYKKSPQNPDYAWHKAQSQMDGFDNIWFFDMKECENNLCYHYIRTDDETNRGWKDVDDGDMDAWIQLDKIDGSSDDRFLWKIAV